MERRIFFENLPRIIIAGDGRLGRDHADAVRFIAGTRDGLGCRADDADDRDRGISRA